jgi:hypothetical protein
MKITHGRNPHGIVALSHAMTHTPLLIELSNGG